LKDQTATHLAGLYVDPRDSNNLEVFAEREAFLRAAKKVVPEFIETLVEATAGPLKNWLERHEQKQLEVYSWDLTKDASGEWRSEQRLDPPTRPLFMSVPRRMLTETFNFYDRVNGGAWIGAPHIGGFRRLNDAIRNWAARFHLEEEWAIHAAQCAALVSLPKLDHPFMVVMEATPPLPMNYFDGPFLGKAILDPRTANPGSELPAAALLPPPPLWNRRAESEGSYSTRLRTWNSQHVALIKAFAAEKGERKIPRKRKRIFVPDLRYVLAAEYQCNLKSFIDLEDTYKGAENWKESSDPGIAIEREVYRLFRLIGLKPRPSN
jgi:hypothetical protein